MRLLLILLLSFSVVSCSLKEAADNGFKTKSEIKPFAPAEKLDDKYGDKITLKIPLTESSVGYFDIEDVLGNRELDSDQKGFIKRLFDGFKLKLYNLGVGLGFSNKIKFSTYYDFGKINPDFLKSARVTKVFFTTEDCRKEERDCDGGSRSSNFNFVDKFFVNVSNFLEEPKEEDDDEAFQIMQRNQFNQVARKSFQQTEFEVTQKLLGFSEGEDGENIGDEVSLEEDFQEINLVKFSNNVPPMKLNTTQITDEDRDLHFPIKDPTRRSLIKKYFRAKQFKKLVRRVQTDRKGVYVTLKRDAKPSAFFALISSEQSPTAIKMYIFRLNSKFIEAKKYFSQPIFKNIVKDTTMIGRSLFVELKDSTQIAAFESLMDNQQAELDSQLDIYKMERCLQSNCLDLEVKDVNLVPLLLKNPKLKIDSYISVRTIGSSDFKYNGYIEIEVDISLPL